MLLLSIVLLGGLTIYRLERQYVQQVEASLRTRAILIGEFIQAVPDLSGPRLQERIGALGKKVVTRITVLDDAGRVLADTDEKPADMENHADRPEIREAQTGEFGSAIRYSTTLGQSMMYVAVRVPGDSAGVAYVRAQLTRALDLMGIDVPNRM